MKLIYMLTMITGMLYSTSTLATQDKDIKSLKNAKPSKDVILKDRAGRKKLCKEYIVKERINGKNTQRKVIICK